MKSQWLGNLKGEEREKFRQTIVNSKIVLDKLNEIVYNMYKDHGSVSFGDYDSPSWSHKQAHTNGYREALLKVLDLLELDNTATKVTTNG